MANHTGESLPTNENAADDGVADDGVLVSSVTGAIRVGSPFAVDPPEIEPMLAAATRVYSGPSLYDLGPLRYTAMGSVAAAALVVGFGAAAAWWFPSGGTIIATLGCGLALFGMVSVYRFTSSFLLLVHLSLFVLSFFRSVSG